MTRWPLPGRGGAPGAMVSSMETGGSGAALGARRDTSSVAYGDTFPLRTELPLRESPVLRSAYFPKTVHWTVFSKTLDLQGCAPPGEPSRGSLLGGFGYDDTIFPWRLPPFSIRNEPRSCTASFFFIDKADKT